MATCVALVPARLGSKRIQSKNIRRLGEHPLIAYTLGAAHESGVFASVVVSTESPEVAKIATHYGGEVPFLRKPEYSGDLSPDIEWVEYTLSELASLGRTYDAFSILRPTSPFRRSDTIRRAWDTLVASKADSIRAVERCRQHPGKMWVIENGRMRPLLPGGPKNPPWHSTPYQALPEVYAQNASLEIAWSRVVTQTRSISGESIAPFVTEGEEGFDINDPKDWIVAEDLVKTGATRLPGVRQPPYVEAVG